jgi:CubicO group peptidase (beta-lactamase class C family)
VADKCDPIRSKLHGLEVQLRNTPEYDHSKPDRRNTQKPHKNPEWTSLTGQIASTRLALQQCSESLRRFTVTGDAFIGSIEIDALVSRFMKLYDIRAMSVAIAREGTLIGNRGYTWAQPNYPITRPDTVFRIASVSKIFTCAAIDNLRATGVLTFATPAFRFLGISSTLLPDQTADPDVDKITVKELATGESGLQRDFWPGGDLRPVAGRLGLSVTPTRDQLGAYIYGEPLLVSPGTAVPPIYSNSAFAVLTSIVVKASQLTFIEYLRRNILLPLGIDDVRVGATAANGRFPNEVSTYDAVGFGPSQLDMAANATEPNAYGGQFTFENGCDGEGALVTSSGTVARVLSTHAVWDIGPRKPGTRYGDLAGTGAVAVSRPDGLDFACAFNHEVDDPAKGALVSQINAVLDRHLVVHPGGVVASISRFIIRLVDRVLRVVGLRLDP